MCFSAITAADIFLAERILDKDSACERILRFAGTMRAVITFQLLRGLYVQRLFT